ncbi:stage II sporulation protein D [Virgibacillus pantothenticus]|uniref:stage II sporulation protein D n=1 Tax=Virgibacillus TaxID=84406 RepID=UPI000956A122|nr:MULTISPECIES: stage II sporulation protein D [Virgibacillus]MBS7430248.1 stage II sporulation protein D [Virgibacillus sp. 19R1-5]MBU8566571.1 stage II sporulation protein D [Virgibacillus pantothenticus]MBU8599063.1 stage II sporulation protein D [Virgibacillus pantothenticus]MBU8634728.1 stage II sporulation protein D [Virgibacillus pantothenticus]MBU8641189.1 stage II sporulation protein D [Virgibacillus pantothenticus]
MKPSKYSKKSGSKEWKKRNALLMKKVKAKQQNSMQQKQLVRQPLANKKQWLAPKKPYYLQKKSRQLLWKVPSAILLVCLITIILVVPTLIVVPYSKGDEKAAKAPPTAHRDKAPKQDIELGNSPFSVSVMRSGVNKVEGIPLEEYVVGVVASEMPADFEPEALKAQSLAARTYIVNQKLHGGSAKKDSDVTDTVQHQVYKDEGQLQKQWGSDFDWKMKKVKEAVSETKGEVLTYKDAPITPAFFSTSNGYTENSEDYWENKLPYLRSVKSPWDEESPKFLDQKTFSLQQLEETLEVDLPNQFPLPVNITRTDSNRVEELQLAKHAFSGRKIREKLELRSSDFTIEQKNNHFIFTTKGFGHGIGMSQYGANGMAKEGKTYQDIVQYYYQDVKISTINDTAPTLVAK